MDETTTILFVNKRTKGKTMLQTNYATRVSACGCEGCDAGQCSAACALTCMVPNISSADASAGTRVLGQATTSAGTWAMVSA
jgi:hypothetical protein